MNKEVCFFYSRTNGCKYGLECSKLHLNPSRSNVVVVKNMYLYPRNDPTCSLNDESIQIHLDLFYEDWFTEISINYGSIKQLIIASNNCPQLIGNIYIQFNDERDGMKCIDGIKKRYYSGKRIIPEFGNCSRIDDGICTDHHKGTCGKGEQCSFIHVAKVSPTLTAELFTSQQLLHKPRY